MSKSIPAAASAPKTSEVIIEALREIMANNRLTALNITRIIFNFDPQQMSIHLWLRFFEQKAERLGLPDELKMQVVTDYLPNNIASWLFTSSTLTTWERVKLGLNATFGVNPVAAKALCKKKLQQLKQGKTPSKQFKTTFEAILQELPDEVSFGTDQLRIMYLKAMAPHLRTGILGRITATDSWDKVANAAIACEGIFGDDTSLLVSTYQGGIASTFHTAPSVPQHEGPTPMEIDAFTPRIQQGPKHGPQPDNMRRWARPGVPICGYCNIEGHLTKGCFKKPQSSSGSGAGRQQIHALLTCSSCNGHAPAPNTVEPTVTAEPQYYYVPSTSDPVHQETIHSLTYMSQPVTYRGPKLSCTIQGETVNALMDTGATISAIQASLVEKLGLTIDTSKSVAFTTANNQSTSSVGTVNVQGRLGEIPINITCHVVRNLAHLVIIGYKDMRALKAIIDTDADSVTFPRGSHERIIDSGSPCGIVACIKLPGHHHAYIDITGAPNVLAFISTPGSIVGEKLLSVAAGVVQFDSSGVATVKLANLNTSTVNVNKGQHIAFIEYLPSSPKLSPFSNSNRTNSRIHTLSTSKSPTVTNGSAMPQDFTASIGNNLQASEVNALKDLLGEFSDCFEKTASTVTPLVQHTINTGTHRPIAQPPHRASAAENETIGGLIDEMLQQGIVRPSNSPWSSAVVLVTKSDGSPRFCVDYRRINAISTRDVYPLPRIDDTLHNLGNAKYFSTLDLTASYWQIELDDESKAKSAFVCRKGLYEFVRMPFGLCNAPATMQRLMDSVLVLPLTNTSKTSKTVLSRLRSASLTANLKKCKFGSNKISFLGYIVSSDGLHTDPEKIRAVADFPVPTSIETLRSFLGLAGYYRSFISQFSVKSAPLNQLLKKEVPWSWSLEHQTAYDVLKQSLLAAPVLRFPDFGRPFELHTDGACSAGLGVMLCQRDPRNNKTYAVAFASRSLTPAEKNYDVSSVEAPAIVWGIRKFAHYLASTKFKVITDHQALQVLNKTTSVDIRGRLARWALTLQQHQFEVIYRPAKLNTSPDALSRYPVVSIAQDFVCSLFTADIVAAQLDDPFCQDIRNSRPLRAPYSEESGVLVLHGEQKS
ncbi:hypothetical protein INT47_006713, partial [Mucor saturninus]